MFNNGIGKVMTSVYFDHNILELNKKYVFEDHEKHVYVIVILLTLFMMVLKIILIEGNMVIKNFMSLKHLSLC